MSADGMPPHPLAGVRALEFAEVWAGPYCGSLLGDLGAEIIKVESIQRTYRGLINPPEGAGGYPEGEPGQRPWNRFAVFNGVNRNKMGLTLDLTSSAGADVFKELLVVSDVVFTNYAYGVMDSFGLGYDALRQIKPDVVMLSMPGYGNTGPYRGYRSMGMGIDAISGHSSLRGYPDLDPSSLSISHHSDAVAAVTAVFAICAALFYRARTGKGQFIDMSQSETFLPHLGEVFLEFGMTGRIRERRGNWHPSMAPHGCYPCAGEDRWVAIAVRDDEEWQTLCQVEGLAHLAGDTRFATSKGRLGNRETLDGLIGEWTIGLDRYAITRTLQELGVPAGPVLDCCADTYDDPHLQDRGYFQVVDHPEAGTHLLSGPIWGSHCVPRPVQAPAPCLGEHNSYVLGQVLGLPTDVLKDLEDRGVTGMAPLEGADMGGVRRFQKGI